MNKMQHEVLIARPPDAVFTYASTPSLWPEWHPASLRLAPGADHSLRAGETFEEDIKTAGRDGHLSWVVIAHDPSVLWAARAVADNGAKILVRYRFSAHGAGTLFQRELEYEMPNLVLRILNVLLLRRRIERESRLSLQQLKTRLETAAEAVA